MDDWYSDLSKAPELSEKRLMIYYSMFLLLLQHHHCVALNFIAESRMSYKFSSFVASITTLRHTRGKNKALDARLGEVFACVETFKSFDFVRFK